jgi:hypothetical protein
MDRIKDLIKKRAANLGNETLDIMTEAKLVIHQQIRAEVRALSYKDGILKIATEDGSAASEIRLSKNDLIAKINKRLNKKELKDIAVTIR